MFYVAYNKKLLLNTKLLNHEPLKKFHINYMYSVICIEGSKKSNCKFLQIYNVIYKCFSRDIVFALT